ncbi:potassium transporter Trk [Nonlabens dokdonensis]|uniref:Potassium transporter Trk n=1 Tax=Nonlabens dokdonensis TaxID=328515 RepID=A0A1Z8B9G4_9FLAO|nr:NAD(P)-binding domain-containing protein [Nonlabens dokdonensis]OUS19246.1 potassium transporter Trk [Nonlabens dokdonensis]
MSSKVYDYIIIGAAQAGLSMAYHLQKKDKNFLILDGGKEIGESWLNRWDSLQLFTTTEYNHLPGFKFKAPKGHYPSKVEVAQYFKDYVNHFSLPVRLNTLITSVGKKDGVFYLEHNTGTLHAAQVIVATGPFHTPYTPPCHRNIAESVVQMHSNYYKGLHQLQDGDALVVGAGDSGYQILDEISASGNRKVFFSGDTTVKSIPQQFLGKTIWWWFTKTGFLSFNKYSWMGKKIISSRQPVIGTDVKEILSRENVEAVGRTKNAVENEIIFESKKVKTIKNVVWATGYRPNFSWIEGLELDEDHYPKNYRGVSNIEGLYFIGLPWMYTRGSATLGGVSKDAAYLVERLLEAENEVLV